MFCVSRAAWLFASLLMCSLSSAAHAETFDKPEAIVANVAFWKNVYGVWSTDDIVFHDEDDLGIVYRVVRVPKRGQNDEQGRTRAEVVALARSELGDALAVLEKTQPADDTALEGVQKEVFHQLKGIARPDKYRRGSTMRVQNGIHEKFTQAYINSGLYEGFIRQKLREADLPEELIAIAFVESMFILGARSGVGAAGIWQFMSYTGKEYMHVNDVVDERWDPMLATEAAVKYLQSSKRDCYTWPLAVTSYNYGRGGVRKLAKDANSTDFNVIFHAPNAPKRFGFSARNYYASFLAVLEVLAEADTLLAGVTKKDPWRYDVVRTPFAVLAPQLVATGHVSSTDLDALNPALRDEALSGAIPLPHGMSLRVPVGAGEPLVRALLLMNAAERARAGRSTRTHVATGKQSLPAIAKRYGLPVDVVVASSGLAVDVVPTKNQKVSIPHAVAGYSLLPEARTLELPVAPATVDGADVRVAAAAVTKAGPAVSSVGELTLTTWWMPRVAVDDIVFEPVDWAIGAATAAEPWLVDVVVGAPRDAVSDSERPVS
jgi:membrane-bound lytic murein transglycosylase D